METEILRKIGLSEQEIKIYLGLLELNVSTATKIAVKTGIDRATTYRFLESLIDRGLVSYVIENNIKYFSAAHPQKILKDLKEKEEEYRELLPQLIELGKTAGEETKVEIYRGKEGLKTVLKDVLKEKKPYTFIGESEKFYVEFPFYSNQWLRQVEKNKIRGRVILKKGIKIELAKTEECKHISKEFISEISTCTYGTKTALFIWSKPLFAIIIDNKDVAESNLALFNFLWKTAK